MKSHSKLFFLLPFVFLISCAQPIKRSQAPEPLPFEEEEKMADFSEEKEEQSTGPTFALFYRPHPKGNPQHLIDFLKENEKRRLTLIFPAQYFEPDYRKPFIEQFRVFLTSGQIEIALTLDNEPMLPLLADLGLGENKLQVGMLNTNGRMTSGFNWPVVAPYIKSDGINFLEALSRLILRYHRQQ